MPDCEKVHDFPYVISFCAPYSRPSKYWMVLPLLGISLLTARFQHLCIPIDAKVQLFRERLTQTRIGSTFWYTCNDIEVVNVHTFHFQLLQYASTTLLFSDKKIDETIINWNRVILLHGNLLKTTSTLILFIPRVCSFKYSN